MTSGKYLLEKKYHPNTVNDIILPKRIKNILSGIVKSGNLGGFVFSGSAGSGKTTSAQLICEDLGISYEVIHASVNNGVDYVRNNIMDKAQAGTTNGGFKVLILDEADYMSVNAQSALRNVINVTQGYCRYILTANYPEKIIPALRGSRLPEISFALTKDEMLKEVAPTLWNKIIMICKEEGYEIEDIPSLQKWMVGQLPNIRYIIKMLQLHGETTGKIPKEMDSDGQNLSIDIFKKSIKFDHENLMKFIYRTPQRTIIKFMLDNLTQLFDTDEDRLQAINWASSFQAQSKGIEELYTLTMLMNISTLIT